VSAGELARVTVVMMAVAAAMNLQLLPRLGSALPHDLGDPLLNTFILGWDADRILHGLKGLWDAPFYFPRRDALAYSEHLLGIAFFTAPIQWLTGNAVLADALDVYPRAFHVEGETDDGARVELFSGSVMAHVMTSLVREPRRLGITVMLPKNRVRAIYLRQTGQARHTHWSIVDLSLWERTPALSERTGRR